MTLLCPLAGEEANTLSLSKGMAIDTGGSPPGKPIDDSGLVYRLVVDGTSMYFDYLVLADIKEFRVTNMIWLG